MNIYDIIIIFFIAVLLAAAVAYIIKNRGKSGCGGCSGCEYGKKSCNRRCGKDKKNSDNLNNSDDKNEKS